MRLKRLELLGFKSFADRTLLTFERGLVGIVGPNGCGKSNVVDAIRWVLGEQRAKSMRGAEMIDVIFKGSASRPAQSVAEVTMTLDNSGGTLEGHGAEVAVTRRVYRSGEGEYLIDGERVRLKDVREMLFGTGLGSRGYSVLEQGRIDAVLSANPVERRAIFEEAAGISRYRQRKKEAESRLKRVEADCLRLDDLIGELEKRQRSLKIQAGKAQRYIAARDAWRVDGLSYARHRMHVRRDELAALGRELAALERESAERRQRRDGVEEDVAGLAGEQATVSGELERLSAESSDLAGEVRAIDERRTQLHARAESWRKSAADESARADQLETRLGERREEARQLDEAHGGLAAEVQVAGQSIEDREVELAELQRAVREARAAWDRQNERVLGLLSERTSWDNRVQHLEEAVAPLDERMAVAARRRDEARAVVEEAQTAERRSADELAQLEASRARLDEELRASDAESRACAEAVETIAARRSELEITCAKLQSRVEQLVDWEREREELEAGARDLFEGLERGEDGPRLAAEIAGLVADHLRADTGDALALDAALGARAEALVLQRAEDVASVVAWLKERHLGRASVVLPGGLAARAVREPDGELLARPGVVGRLLERVQVAAGYEALARTLLGDVVLVADVAAALELVGERPELRYVTATGDLIDAAGARGGHVALVAGAVGRRSFAADLDAQRAETERQLAACDAELETKRGELAERHRRLDELRGAKQELERGLARVRGDVEAAAARREDLERSVKLFEHECAGLAEDRRRMETELAEARTKRGESEAAYQRESAELSACEERRVAREGERDEVAREESRTRVEAAGLEERLEALERRRSDLAHAIEDTAAELERARRLAREQRESADGAEADAERLAAERDELLERRGALETRLSELRERDRGGREAIEALRQKSAQMLREIEDVQGVVSDRRLAQQRIELSLEEIARRAEEDFAIPSAELLDGFEPSEELAADEALGALGERVTELKQQMERCGPVNLEAVTELEEVSERFEFLSTQRADLGEARRTLLGAIQKLNEESERRFLETFDEVRTHFRSIFRQLFGGGRADVSLAEGEDVLEAGIEIIARPPGRETLPITLLSGGQRTLTALAMLFAVFRAQPSPFCILDEVDAALDDANIGRFLALLRETVGETQFVVVTHNKGTMAACELLYGVTMAIRGVSRVVSVELDEVDEIVPEASGSFDGGGAGGNGNGNGHARSGESPRARGAEDAGEPDEAADGPSASTADEDTVELVPFRGEAAPSAGVPENVPER